MDRTVSRLVAVVGEAKARESPRDVERAVGALRRHADVALRRVSQPAELADVLERGPERVVVLGGDGSVQRLVQALQDHGRLSGDGGPDVALVPLGTGNDLARGVGIPLDVPEAARLAVHGDTRPLAVLLGDDERVVVNAAHVGVGAAAARTAEEASSAKSVLGGVVYSAAAVVAGLRTRGWHLRVRVDGQELHDGTERVLMVAIGLGRTIGGGAPVAPRADPVAGRAQVTVSRSIGWAARFAYAAALRRGTHMLRSDVSSAPAQQSVEVALVRGEPFQVDADGELTGPFTSRTWTVRPGAWRLVTP